MKCIELTKGRVAIVDDSDFEYLAQYRWRLNQHGYAVRSQLVYRLDGKKSCRMVFMHRTILNPPPGFFTDHINNQRLDNRRCNLRVATKSQNGANSKCRKDNQSGLKGVGYDKRNKKKPWRAHIGQNGKFRFLGTFTNKEDAHAAYCAAAIEQYGDFARFN